MSSNTPVDIYRCRRMTVASRWLRKTVYTLLWDIGRCLHRLYRPSHFQAVDTDCCYLLKEEMVDKHNYIVHTTLNVGVNIAVVEWNQWRAITCAERHAFTCGTDGFLAFCPCLLILAVLAARAVSVTAETHQSLHYSSPGASDLTDDLPALYIFSELALWRTTEVIIEMEEPWIAVFPFFYSGVPTDFTVSLLEAHRSLELQRLSNRSLAAIGETLWGINTFES